MTDEAQIAGAAPLATSTGCFKQEFATALPAGGATHVETAPFYLYGLIGEHQVDLKQICPNGVSSFSRQQTFGNSCMGAITCGIYVPLTVEVRCASGSAFLLTPDEGRGVTWVEALEGGEG